MKLKPREKFLKYGAAGITDEELLAIVLGNGVHGKPVLPLAEELLTSHGGNLLSLSTVHVSELMKHRGIGAAKALSIAAVFALARRLASLRLASLPLLNSPEIIAEYVRENLRSPQQEEFHALLLDGKFCLLRDQLVTMGLIDRSLVHAREVFRAAIRESCSKIILAHNHPSGDVEPSEADIKSTRDLCLAGEVIGITVLDHIIVAGVPKSGQPSFYSFRASGLLQKISPSR